MIPSRFFDRLKFWDFGNTVTIPLPLVCIWIFVALDTAAGAILVQSWNRSLIASANHLIEADRKLEAWADELHRQEIKLEQSLTVLQQQCDGLEQSQAKLQRADAKLIRDCELSIERWKGVK